MPIPDNPQTRQEMYLNAMATGDSSGIPESPQTREEMYLDAIVKNGSGGGGGGGGGPLLVHFTYDEDNDRYPGDSTASQVYASCLTYGFAVGGYVDDPARVCIITGYNVNGGYYFKLGTITGIGGLGGFTSFDTLPNVPTKYLADEYLCGYYNEIT